MRFIPVEELNLSSDQIQKICDVLLKDYPSRDCPNVGWNRENII